MTFSLRRKRQTTPRCARFIPTATAVSLAGWLWLASGVHAQDITDAVAWQSAPRAGELPAPTPTVRPAAFQKQEQPEEKKETPPGTTLKFPPSRDPARGPSGLRSKAGEEADYVPRTDMPGLDRLTRRESEQQFYERIRQEARRSPTAKQLFFPETEPASKEPYTLRQFPHMVQTVAPSFVCHGRLYFEQPNYERHGWHLGPLTPAVNLVGFYYDLALLPYHYFSEPCSRYDCSSGKCLPGDPTPLLLYRERFSLTGLVGQAGTIAGGLFIP